MAPRISSLLNPPIGFAHRGARALERDNTIASFQLAVRLGATALESDVWISKDGHAVLDHDGMVGRVPRRRKIADLDRRDLPAHMPTLSELLDEVGTEHALSLDIKAPAAFDAVAGAIADADPSDELASRTWICHPDTQSLVDWRSRVPALRYVHSVRKPKLTVGIEQHAADLAAAGIAAMNMHYSDWSGGLTTLFHRFDILAFGWDAQHERVLAELLDLGIDAVYSDHVERMQAAIANR